MSHNTFEKLLTFLDQLEQHGISYSLAHQRDNALMVSAAAPGERWEIEFFTDGSIEAERFISNGAIGGADALPELISRYAEASVSFLVPKLRLGTRPAKLRFATLASPNYATPFYNSFMTRTRYRIYQTHHPYFLTCTIVGWLPVFTRPEAVNIVYDSWRFLQQNREFRLYGYVILENHLHLIASAPDLTAAVKSFKMYTARNIIDLLERHSADVLLRQLRAHKLAHKTRSEYQVWQEGSKPKEITGDEMMLQKLEYMHNNPLDRGYVDDVLHWRYSSARNYDGQEGLIEVVTDWR